MIKKTKKDSFGPMFKLYGAGKNEPHARLEYYDDQLIRFENS
jgi:hypothetical protein